MKAAWRSVTDSLPQENETVLLFSRNDGIEFGLIDREGHWWAMPVHHRDHYVRHDVRYWQPLERPEGEPPA